MALVFGPGKASAAQASGANGACGGQATSVSAQPSATLGGPGAFDIAKWFGEKAAGALVGKGAGMAFDFLSKITGLDKILPETADAKILKELEAIKLQLAGISQRLEQLTELVNQLITEERQFHLDTALARLCTASDSQQVLYTQQYIPMVNAGVQLGAILEGPNPQLADVKDASGLSPRERVVALRKDFLRFYETNALVLERGIREIHAALVPGALQTSVLAAYGQVLMTKRFLNRGDSESLQGLYGDLAQTEALASWMAAEYRSASPQNPEAFRNVITAYLGNTKEEQANLPRLIPAGAVVDLGKVNSISSAQSSSMWAPST